MIVYFAGNTGSPDRDAELVKKRANRLFSFHYHSEEANFRIDWDRYMKGMKHVKAKILSFAPPRRVQPT